MVNSLPAPFEAYEGEKPFIFVSYDHKDRKEVYQDLSHLHRAGYRTWYDQGIRLGQEFPEKIQRAIQKCSYFIAFLSPDAVDSQWVRNEIFFAIAGKKNILVIHLQKTELTHGLGVQLAAALGARKYELSSEGYFQQLQKALPTYLIERPPQESDFAKEIEISINCDADCSDESFFALARLMGLTKDVARQVIDETLNRLGITKDSPASEEKFRQLVRFLLRRGPIHERSRETLVSQAETLRIPSTRWKVIMQNEALLKAKELNKDGRLSEAYETLASTVGKDSPKSSQIRKFLKELQAKKSSTDISVLDHQYQLQPQPKRRLRAVAKPDEVLTLSAQSAVDSAITPIDDRTEIRWICIPGGPFIRGCPQDFIRYIENEYGVGTEVLQTYPERKEVLEKFWISLTPITNTQFYTFVKAVGHRYPAGWRGTTPPYSRDAAEKPVTSVTWQDSVDFAEWVGDRLPTRAEYEKACRGETGLLFPWGNTFDVSKCNTAESGREKILPVGTIAAGASPYGVLDLVGNVWQWAADGERELRMTVGASYKSTGEIYGAGFFDLSRPPESSEKDLGFRIACDDVYKLFGRTEKN